MWYGAERLETAIAEMVSYRILFYAKSPDTPFLFNPKITLRFRWGVSSACALDLTMGSLANDHGS